MHITPSLLLIAAAAVPVSAHPQSLLDRPPNMSGDWTGAPGTVHFNFVHRFTLGNAPERKVTNIPTLSLAAGLPQRTLIGINYSSNSVLVSRKPNEWEAFARWMPISEDFGAPIDLGAQIGYDNASEGAGAEISAARRFGPVRLLVAGRSLADPFDTGRRYAVAGGATFRLGQFVALAGDVGTLIDRDTTERVAWSAGVHFAIPLTPHTVSFHASNALITTLQGASRGFSDVQYGFEFTVPITLRRYFGRRAAPEVDSTMGPTAIAEPGLVRTTIRNTSYVQPRLRVTVGTTVEWTNRDPMQHSVTAVGGEFNSMLIDPGKTFRHTFTKAGTYEFLCMPHPFMKGVVVVTEH